MSKSRLQNSASSMDPIIVTRIFVDFAKGPSCRANIVGILCRTNTVKKLDKYCLEWLVGQILWKTWNGSSDKGELRRHVIGHTSTRILALHQDPAQHLSSRKNTCLLITTSNCTSSTTSSTELLTLCQDTANHLCWS